MAEPETPVIHGTPMLLARYSHFDRMTRSHVWISPSGTRVHISEVAFVEGKPPTNITVVENIRVPKPIKSVTHRRTRIGRVMEL